MKKKISRLLSIVTVFLTTLTLNLSGDTGKTFFSPRAIGQDLVMQKNMSQHFLNEFNQTKVFYKEKVTVIRKKPKKREPKTFTEKLEDWLDPGYFLNQSDFYPYLNFIPQKNKADIAEIEPRRKSRGKTIVQKTTVAKEKRNLFFITPTVFYKSSTNRSKLCKYFFPENKTELVIKGNQVDGEKDIAAEWLHIANSRGEIQRNFESKISIRPKQESFGVNVNIHQNLNFISDKLLLSVNLPFVQVKTDVHLKEYDIQNAPEQNPYDMPYHYPTNVVEYFNNTALKYSKLKNGVLKLNDLADIQTKLSYEIKRSDSQVISIYGQASFPTGQKPTAEYIFEPIAGNGGYFALGLGADFEFELSDHFDVLATADFNYLFQTNQKRTLDLTNGQWSRYLLLITQDQFPINGANILTRDCSVTPGSQFQTFLALHYQTNDFHVEIGHNFWYKTKEDVDLNGDFPTNIGIAKLNDHGNITGQTISTATIATDPYEATPDAPFTAIKTEDLNISSATHPSTLSNQFYVACGLEGNFKKNPYQANVGFAYEIGNDNEALSQWSLWLALNVAI